jgi:signal transduction histidine kinase
MLTEPAPPAAGAHSAAVEFAGPSQFETSQWWRKKDLVQRLHDDVAQPLQAVVLHIGLLRHRNQASDRLALVSALERELRAVLSRLREVEGEIYPPLLREAGLVAALQEAVSGRPVEIRGLAPQVHPEGDADRLRVAVDGAAYYAIVGCLDDLPSTAAVDIEVSYATGADDAAEDAAMLVVVLVGVAGEQAEAMREQVMRVGGTVGASTLDDGRPAVTVRIPCG